MHVEIKDTLKKLSKIFTLSPLDILHNTSKLIHATTWNFFSFSPNTASLIQSYPKLFRNIPYHKRVRSMLKSERARILINFANRCPFGNSFFFSFFFYRCTIFVFNLNVSAAKYAATIFHDVSIINFRQFRAPLRISNKSRG